jgi:hypothetical protein
LTSQKPLHRIYLRKALPGPGGWSLQEGFGVGRAAIHRSICRSRLYHLGLASGRWSRDISYGRFIVSMRPVPQKPERLTRSFREKKHDGSGQTIRNQILALRSSIGTPHAARMRIPELTNSGLALVPLIPFSPISTFPLFAKRVFGVSSVFCFAAFIWRYIYVFR